MAQAKRKRTTRKVKAKAVPKRRRNSFGAAVLEGAGTGIGLGLAGAAALPLVKRAFPGLMKGKANPKPEAELERSSDGYTAYTKGVRGGRKHISSSAYLDRVISAAGAKGYVFDENRIGSGISRSEFVKATTVNTYDTGTGEERSVRVYVKGVQNPVHPEPSMQRWGKIGEAIGAAGKSADGLLDSYAGELADYSMSYVSRARAEALRGWNRGRRSTGARMENPQRNPGPQADAMYESFHGVPSTGYEEIIDERHYHGHLAELGSLVSIKVMPQYGKSKGRLLELDFSKADVLLCSNEEGTHLYFRGGNQEVSLKALGFTGHLATKDLVDLGIMHEITYQTKKGFDNFKRIDYYHQLGEVSKDTQPTLLYDTLNHELQTAGGSYVVLPAGITD